MNRTLTLLATVAMILTAGAPTSAQTIKLGTLAPKGTPWYETIRDVADAWKKISGGRVEIRIYPGGVAGDDSDMVRKMRVGQLDAAALTAAGLADITPDIRALQMPMMLRSDEELEYVRRHIGRKIEARLAARGFMLLTWADAGWLHFFTQSPVVRPEDLIPLKIFAWSADTGYIDAWKDAGYKPVPLAATEIHIALQTGMINAVPAPPVAALSYQWFGQAKHMTDLKWVPLVGALVISTRAWRAIPDDVKPRFRRVAADAGALLQRSVPELEKEAIKVMRRYGLKVHPVPRDEILRWERRARAGYASIVGSMVSAELVAEVERLRNEYRAKRNGR